MKVIGAWLTEETVNVFVGDFRKRRQKIVVVRVGNLLKDCSELLGYLLASQLYKPEAGTLIEDDHKQQSTDNGDVYAFTFSFMRKRRELFLTDKLCHAAGSRNISRSQ